MPPTFVSLNPPLRCLMVPSPVRGSKDGDSCRVFLFRVVPHRLDDLKSYFHITDVYEAVMEPVEEASRLECLMLDITPDANLDLLFRHLENSRFSEMALGREKAKGDGSYRHPSWLRIYAIKIDQGAYLVTGGAIKLTATMAERCHTLSELAKLEKVRNYLMDNGVFDKDGLTEYIDNEQGN